jgi:hypothetical protein
MKRALVLVLPIAMVAAPAYAQQATPEDFGVPPQQQQQQPQQPAPTTTQPAPSPQITVVSGNAPPATPYPTTPTPAQEEAKLKEFKPAIKAQLGYQYARLHSVPINAGRFRLGVGAQNDVQAHYFTFSSFVGATETDRRVWDLRVGYEGELRLAGILRLGLGLETGYVFVRRASIDERMWALGIGAQAHVGVDAVAWGPRDDHALYVEARIEGHIHWGNADMWGPTLSVGVRF